MAKKQSNIVTFEVRERKKKRKSCERMARRLGLAPIGAASFELLKRGRNEQH